MGFADERRERQNAIVTGGENLRIGSQEALPVSLEELTGIGAGHPAVRASFGGLTAEVFCVGLGGRLWNLKKKRARIRVQNMDGQLSFYNELEQRRRLEAIRQEIGADLDGVVRTVFADLRAGVILSPWIDGGHVKKWKRAHFRSLFSTLLMMDRAGIMEYDLCPGNLLERVDGRMMLFDFGYAYPYDPRCYYNADGHELPMFHPVERFESRSFMQYLMDLEISAGRETALSLYREEKEEALAYYGKRRCWLAGEEAEPVVLEWMDGIIGSWETGLGSSAALEDLYAMESFRSYVMDLEDDLHGKTCTPATLKKADRILETLDTRYSFFKDRDGFFWGDEELIQDDLIDKYRRKREEAVGYQI